MMSLCAAPSPHGHADAGEDDVVLGFPIDDAAAARLRDASSSASSLSLATGSAGSSSLVSTASMYSARLTLTQRASHARSLVLSPQAFVVFGGYLRLRESAREWRMKTWYCALLRSQVYFYPSKRDATRATNLVRCVTVAAPGAKVSDGVGIFHVYKNAFTFSTTHGGEFFCSAPSENEQTLWVDQLTQAAAAAAAEDAKTDLDGISINGSVLSNNTGDDEEEEEDVDRDAGSGSASLTQQDEIGAADATLAASAGSSTECFTCGVAFGLVRHTRRKCQSCARHFCRAHCAQYATGSDVSTLSASSVSTASSSSGSYHSLRSRVCDACSHRQHFISFLETFTATAIRLIRHDHVNVSVTTVETAASQPENDRAAQKMRKELAIVVASPASYTVLNVLCLLKKYVHVPWMFTRAMCMLIPLYERNPSALEEYWTQFLVIFVPLLQLQEPFSPSMQFFLRFVSAVCRRSNAFALRTVWECLAFREDARARGDRMTMSYLTLLMIVCSSFDGGATFTMRQLLAHAPRAQVEAITKSLKDFLGMRSVLRDEIPKSLSARWFNALCLHDTERARQLVLAAANEIEDAAVLLDVFDPSQTEYMALLGQHFVRIPPGALDCADDECDRDDEDDAFLAHKEREFDAQAAFVEQLTAISESLRHVQPVDRRGDVLRELLTALEETHLAPTARGDEEALLGQQDVHIHAPLLSAGSTTMLDKLCLLRVVPDEGKVFSTRARAPTMMVFEACPISSRLPSVSTSSRETVTQGIPVDADDEDALLDGELVMSAQLVSMRLRATSRTTIAHKESQLLDVTLCGLKDDDSTSSGSGNSDADDANSANNPSEDAGSRPDELLVQEARETYEDSALGPFMASFRGGESSSARSKWKRRIRAASPFGAMRGWTLISLIAKSHDDLRQEVFAMQLMRNVVEIFENNELHRLYLRPYDILCTGANVGLIETLVDAQSVDAVKKQYGSLAECFAALFGSPSGSRFQAAQDAFITSVAASSLYCYLFQIKDRHNGNIMLDQRGHIMHIDFGFMMGAAPGGAFSLEDAPFKLTREMVELMGGLHSRGYHDFVELFTEGFLAVRREYIKLVTLLHLTAQNSPFPCFQNQSSQHILRSFRQRLFLAESSEDAARGSVRRLVDKSFNHWGTRQYDRFQYSSNGILP